MCGEQLQGFMAGPGGVPTGIDPSLLTSAAFELVQASQALQAVQAVQPLLHAESPPMMTPLTQDPSLLSSMDPAQIAAAVQHCPIPLDSALQVATSGGAQVQLQYSTAMPGSLPSNGVLTSSGVAISGAGTVAGVPLLTDCSQHTQPITNFGHQLLLPTQFAFGPGQGLPVLEASGSVAVSGAELSNSYGLQLQSNSDLAHLGFPSRGSLRAHLMRRRRQVRRRQQRWPTSRYPLVSRPLLGSRGVCWTVVAMLGTIFLAMVTPLATLLLSSQGYQLWTWTLRLTPTMTQPSPWPVLGGMRSLSPSSSPGEQTLSIEIRRGSLHSSLQPPQAMIRWWKYC